MNEIKIYSEFNKELEKHWGNLNPCLLCNFFQSYNWLKHWFHHVGIFQGVKLVIIVGHENKQTNFIIPLCIKAFGPLKILEFIGGDQTDYNGIIFDKHYNKSKKKFSFKKVLNSRNFPKYDLINFNKIHEISILNNFFLDFENIINSKDKSSYIKLPEKFETIQNNLGKSLLSNTKRKIKKLEKIGNLKLKIIDHEKANSEDLEKIFTFIFKEKGKRFLKTGYKNTFLKEEIRNFYSKMPKKISSYARVHLSILTLDNKIIAAHWGVVEQKNFYWILPAFSDDWLWFSPGRLIMYYLVEWSIYNKLDKFDLTIGDENYKNEWSDKKEKLYNLNFSMTVLGRIYFIVISLKEIIKDNYLIKNLLKFKNKLFFRYMK